MFIHEYGHPFDPVIVLLPPMMVSGKELYELMRPYFKRDYCVIAADLGGHGEAGAYTSAQDDYQTLKAYLIKNGYRQIELVYGASLGAAVGYRLFCDRDLTIAHTFFDGVCLTKKSMMMDKMMNRLFKKRKEKLEKHPTDASKSLVKMYGYDFAKMMTSNFHRLSEAEIKAICDDCTHYDLKAVIPERVATLHLEYGEKDIDYRLSKKNIKKYFGDAQLVLRLGYGHCGYMAHHIENYVAQLEAFMN